MTDEQFKALQDRVDNLERHSRCNPEQPSKSIHKCKHGYPADKCCGEKPSTSVEDVVTREDSLKIADIMLSESVECKHERIYASVNGWLCQKCYHISIHEPVQPSATINNVCIECTYCGSIMKEKQAHEVIIHRGNEVFYIKDGAFAFCDCKSTIKISREVSEKWRDGKFGTNNALWDAIDQALKEGA